MPLLYLRYRRGIFVAITPVSGYVIVTENQLQQRKEFSHDKEKPLIALTLISILSVTNLICALPT